MIYALGDVSGAHFNPAVTLAIALSGRGAMTDLCMIAMYMAVQVGAGMMAGVIYSSAMGAAFPLGPVEPYTWMQAATAEIVFTFVLCLVVLSVATTRTPSKDFF